MMKLTITALALTASLTALGAQDRLTVLPDSYSKQFENEWVRTFENVGSQSSEFLRFDVETKPIASSHQR